MRKYVDCEKHGGGRAEACPSMCTSSPSMAISSCGPRPQPESQHDSAADGGRDIGRWGKTPSVPAPFSRASYRHVEALAMLTMRSAFGRQDRRFHSSESMGGFPNVILHGLLRNEHLRPYSFRAACPHQLGQMSMAWTGNLVALGERWSWFVTHCWHEVTTASCPGCFGFPSILRAGDLSAERFRIDHLQIAAAAAAHAVLPVPGAFPTSSYAGNGGGSPPGARSKTPRPAPQVTRVVVGHPQGRVPADAGDPPLQEKLVPRNCELHGRSVRIPAGSVPATFW